MVWPGYFYQQYISILPLTCQRNTNYTKSLQKVLRNFTVQQRTKRLSFQTCFTDASKPSHLIKTSGVILTWRRSAFVDVCFASRARVSVSAIAQETSRCVYAHPFVRTRSVVAYGLKKKDTFLLVILLFFNQNLQLRFITLLRKACSSMHIVI